MHTLTRAWTPLLMRESHVHKSDPRRYGSHDEKWGCGFYRLRRGPRNWETALHCNRAISVTSTGQTRQHKVNELGDGLGTSIECGVKIAPRQGVAKVLPRC